jgi:two-component system CheB/CheR fusion protein
VDSKYQIYSKKAVSVPFSFDFGRWYDADVETARKPTPGSSRANLQKITDQILLNRYVPASVLVNAKLEIIQFIGPTGQYLDPSPPNAGWNLLKLVKGGLEDELSLAFERIKRTGTIRKEGIPIKLEGSNTTVDFEILPVKASGKDRYYLVVFEEGRPVDKATASKHAPSGVGKKATKALELQLENAHLKQELDATRGYLQSTIEEQRTTNEDLRSANEEIQSSNEELRSVNEELETTTEELQSTNEELTVLNDELHSGNQELSRVNTDLNNLLTNVNISILMLGQDMQIRRFTPMTEKVMNLIPADVGRPITDIKSNLHIPDLGQSIARVMGSLQTHEMEVEHDSGRWYSMRIRPCRTLDNKIDGVVIVLTELDPRLRPKQS